MNNIYIYTNLTARYSEIEDKNDFDVTDSTSKSQKTVKIVSSDRR